MPTSSSKNLLRPRPWSYSLSTIIKARTEKALGKKFLDLQKECEYYHGHDPYNGTWSTMHGILIKKDPFPERKRWTKKKYNDVLEWIWDNTNKWDNAYAIKTPKGYLIGGWAAS